MEGWLHCSGPEVKHFTMAWQGKAAQFLVARKQNEGQSKEMQENIYSPRADPQESTSSNHAYSFHHLLIAHSNYSFIWDESLTDPITSQKPHPGHCCIGDRLFNLWAFDGHINYMWIKRKKINLKIFN